MAIGGLDDGRVTELTPFLLLDDGDLPPMNAVVGDGQIQQPTATPTGLATPEVVVDHQLTTITKGDHFNAGVRIGQVDRLRASTRCRRYRWRSC